MTEVHSFFWYDLETTGVNPREDRIMQFAGIRTNLELEPIGEPVNIFVKLTDDILPSPDAILITGITPQHTITEGVTEAEFLREFYDTVALPGTIFVGFNTVRFDDEFMRYLNYRNYYDPYGWQWQEKRSRWDLLDVVRMTRALRPDGIKWPVVNGKPTNRLELITKLNGISHDNAHDALADVQASIAVAKLIKEKQPKLFNWLLEARDKKKIAEVVEKDEPFVYSSGKYDGAFEKTTVVVRLAAHPKKQGALVFDLRHDPREYFELSPEQLADRWRWTRDESAPARLPIKTMLYNRCPAVAPLGVLSDDSQTRINLSLKTVQKHWRLLKSQPDFEARVLTALDILDDEQEARQKSRHQEVDAQLYDGFFDTHDSNLLGVVRAAKPNELSDEIADSFHDVRLKSLLPLYKARNYPRNLSDEERTAWEAHRHHVLLDGGEKSRLSQFMHRISQLTEQPLDKNGKFILEELQLYAESIMPLIDVD